MSEMTAQQLKNIVEAALLAAGEPLTVERLATLFEEEQRPEKKALLAAVEALQADCAGRGIELRELASGYRYQARSEISRWVSRLWEERAPRYSRALLETLALVAYRQPITRAEIEDIRGVAVSSSIMKTLLERGWVRIIGHRDVPGRPALYASTREFLDYFNLKTLDELPTLGELKDLDKFNAELDLRFPGEGVVEDEEAGVIALSISADFEPVHYD
jgi:segregation and condensation protein B